MNSPLVMELLQTEYARVFPFRWVAVTLSREPGHTGPVLTLQALRGPSQPPHCAPQLESSRGGGEAVDMAVFQ